MPQANYIPKLSLHKAIPRYDLEIFDQGSSILEGTPTFSIYHAETGENSVRCTVTSLILR